MPNNNANCCKELAKLQRDFTQLLIATGNNHYATAKRKSASPRSANRTPKRKPKKMHWFEKWIRDNKVGKKSTRRH